MNENFKFLLNDKRNCASHNLKQFFKYQFNKTRNDLDWRVIRWNGELWFATLGWLVTIGNENGFAGARVKEAACYGKKATTGYPNAQTGGDYQDVTDWFWDKYRERGVVSLPEIWHIKIPKQLKHAEYHTI